LQINFAFKYYNIPHFLGIIIMDEESPSKKDEPLKLSLIAFSEKRHLESIEGISTINHPWRMKERVNYFIFTPKQ